MADDPRAALASLEQQLRELAAELAVPTPSGPAPTAPTPTAPRPQPAAPPPPAVTARPATRPEVLSAAERVAAAAGSPARAPGAVAISAGPFDAADPVLAFRDAVAALPGVRHVLLRRVEDGTALIEVELS